MSKSSIYVETSIVSYLVGRIHRHDLSVAYNQQFTREWWSRRRADFDLYTSPVVIDEAAKGDRSLAAERLQHLAALVILDVANEARWLARDLLRLTRIPAKAELDALHIAVAAVSGMDFLLTWNCAHIANAEILPKVYDVCRSAGYEPPLVCTPLELPGVTNA